MRSGTPQHGAKLASAVKRTEVMEESQFNPASCENPLCSKTFILQKAEKASGDRQSLDRTIVAFSFSVKSANR
jgi:hypothetical protein